MALTRDFKETVQARARRDPGFRKALLREALDCMLAGDIDAGKIVLRDYINATVGFDGWRGHTQVTQEPDADVRPGATRRPATCSRSWPTFRRTKGCGSPPGRRGGKQARPRLGSVWEGSFAHAADPPPHVGAPSDFDLRPGQRRLRGDRLHPDRHRPSCNADLPPEAANHIYYQIAEAHRGRGSGKALLFEIRLGPLRAVAELDVL